MTTPDQPEVHPDFLGGPLDQMISFRTNRAMAAAIRKRALVEDRDLSSTIRELIRAGAPHLTRPLDLSTAAL